MVSVNEGSVSDSTGNIAQWIFLDLLRNWDAKYSWGSGALAYLYRQLDEACRRKKGSSGMGGFVWCLQVWMWERMPAGRPEKKKPHPGWIPHEGVNGDDHLRYPTVSYSWDLVKVYTGSSVTIYKCYINELDMLTHKQVDWIPYDAETDYELNAMCTRDKKIWLSRCPMICFYAVEWHFPDRVARQFGKRQTTPREESHETNHFLHRHNRKNFLEVLTWANKHWEWIDLWNKIAELVEKERRPHNELQYQNHLKWLADRYRLKLKPGWTREHETGYASFNLEARDNEGTQLDYAQLHD